MASLEQLKLTFFEECSEALGQIESGLTALREGAGSDDTINAVFRSVHSVKGGAGIFGFDGLVSFAHVFETVLDAMRDGKLAATPEIIERLVAGERRPVRSDRDVARRRGDPGRYQQRQPDRAGKPAARPGRREGCRRNGCRRVRGRRRHAGAGRVRRNRFRPGARRTIRRRRAHAGGGGGTWFGRRADLSDRVPAVSGFAEESQRAALSSARVAPTGPTRSDRRDRQVAAARRARTRPSLSGLDRHAADRGAAGSDRRGVRIRRRRLRACDRSGYGRGHGVDGRRAGVGRHVGLVGGTGCGRRGGGEPGIVSGRRAIASRPPLRSPWSPHFRRSKHSRRSKRRAST